MRSVSHCANHPSREAVLRCGTCGTWVCERCAREHADRIFCSWPCRLRHDLVSGLVRAKQILSVEVSPAWAIGLTTAVSILLAAGIGSLIAQLLEISMPPGGSSVEVAVPVPPPRPEGRVVIGSESWRLEIEGTPGSSVLVEVRGEPARVVRLSDSGRAHVDYSAFPAGPTEARLSTLSESATIVSAVPTATASPKPSPLATATPSATATPTRTVSPTATVTPTMTPPPVLEKAPPTPTIVQPRTKSATATATVPAPRAADDTSGGEASPPVLHLVPDAGARLALTFDGATSAAGTTDLLDVLRNLNVSVTIFVTGEFIERNPGIVRRAALAGHEFGNHTFSHPHLTTYSTNRRHDLLPHVNRDLLADELRRTEEAFRRATGRSMAPLWRAPFGEENRQLRRWALELGYLHVRWSSLQGASLDSLDWVEDEHSRLFVDPRRLVQRLLEFPRLEGGIVLMHLSTRRRVPPWTELPHFADEIRARGLAIGTVSRLLEASDTWRPWYERAAARHRELLEGTAFD